MNLKKIISGCLIGSALMTALSDCPHLKIKGFSGSAAEKYATSYFVPFEIITKEALTTTAFKTTTTAAKFTTTAAKATTAPAMTTTTKATTTTTQVFSWR